MVVRVAGERKGEGGALPQNDDIAKERSTGGGQGSGGGEGKEGGGGWTSPQNDDIA